MKMRSTTVFVFVVFLAALNFTEGKCFYINCNASAYNPRMGKHPKINLDFRVSAGFLGFCF
jgi:hypothetical protein